MPGTFSYTEATNTIEVTDGTSGAPATFNDMYTADQAGTATDLLLAEAGTSGPGNSLTYPIRPTGDKAILIKCIVAAKTAEADFIFITGTDWRGAVQTESIDVTAGNGSYTSTKYWASVSDFDCSDNAGGGGVQWADGTIQVTQDIWGVVWEYEADSEYKMDASVSFGDGSTATYFQSKNEFVFWIDGTIFSITTAATLELGDLLGSWSIDGSSWSFHLAAAKDLTASGQTGTLLMYGSFWYCRATVAHGFNMQSGAADLRNSTMCGTGNPNGFTMQFVLMSDLKLQDVIFTNMYGVNLFLTPSISRDVSFHNCYVAVGIVTTSATITGANVTSSDFAIYVAAAITLTFKDPVSPVSGIFLGAAASIAKEQYPCNIHVADEDGADLAGVSIECNTFGNVVSNDAGSTFYKCIEDHTAGTFATDLAANKWELTTAAYAALAGCTGAAENGAWVTGIDYVKSATEFTGITTDANGDITEQMIDYKKWVGTSEALLTYSPHTFILTYGGDTHVIEKFAVSTHIIWHLEFPPVATKLDEIIARLRRFGHSSTRA